MSEKKKKKQTFYSNANDKKVYLRGAADRLYASLSASPRLRRAGLSPSIPGKEKRCHVLFRALTKKFQVKQPTEEVADFSQGSIYY